MKKLFSTILVLGLLLGGNAYAKDEYLEDLVPIGSTKQHLCLTVDGPSFDGQKREGTMITPIKGGRIYCHGFNSKHWNYYPQYKTEIISNGKDKVFFVYGDVTQRMSCKLFVCDKAKKQGTGRLIKVAYSKEEAFAYADPTLTASFLKRKKEEEKIICLPCVGILP
jgi:hypothetical protein